MELSGLDLLAIALKVGNLTTMGKENEIVSVLVQILRASKRPWASVTVWA